MLELGQFTYVFQAALVKFDLLIGHDTTDLVALSRRVVQALGHPSQYLLDFLILIVELVTCGHVCLEK